MQYVFIGGSQRTGTSITQQMLCQLPEANPYLYEASYLRQLVSCYTEARNNFNQNHASYFGDVQHLRNFSSGVVHAFLQQVTARLGDPQVLILKEPHLTIYWPYLFELVPEAWFLMMVRDPRDAVASMVSVGEKQKALGQQYLFVNRDIPALCRHFLSFYEPAFDVKTEQFRNQLGVVHYEELVTDPVRTMQDLARFTGIPFDRIDVQSAPEAGHVKTTETSASPLYAPWVTDVSGQKLSQSRVGNYASVLTETEIAEVERECSNFFDWFGYGRRAA
ncbi:MAG: sulfotransferase [Fuerstiella sp.]